MPDVRSVVKQMIADGESEDVIDAVVKKLNSGSDIKSGLPDMSPELKTPDKDEYTGPDTFWGGVKKSLFGDEFNETAKKSLAGFAKGTADIPATLADTAQGLASGVHSLIQDPKAHFRAMGPAFQEMGRGMRDVTMNAGADPEAFGHMSGQIFGQPAFTEGLIRAPSIAKATPGAINRIPRVNKALSSAGSMLEGTRNPNIVPTTSRGLIAGAVRGAARPVGRALQRAGERGRLAGSKVESVGEAAARTTPNKPPANNPYKAINDRNRGRQGEADTVKNYPVVESLNDRAARTPPSAFRKNIAPSEADPMFRSDLETSHDLATRGAETPTPSYDPVDSSIDPMFRSDPTIPPPVPTKPAFEPSIDPAKNFSFEDLQMMKTRRDEVNAILRKMAEENVDVNTGEIFPFQETFPGLEQPPKRARNWSITNDEGAKFADNVNEEMGYSGGEQSIDFANDVGMPETARRFPGDEAFDLGEISPGFRDTPSMPNWGPETVHSPRPVNPLRPEVPPGQVSNRSMFENSAMRGADAPSPGRQFADQVLPHEFDTDMLLTPSEMTQPDIPPMMSPVENPFDPRTSNIDQGRTIQPEEWGDWGDLTDTIPTLVPDANGSHVSAPGRKFAQEVEAAGVPFDDANPDFNDPFIRDTERMDRALKNRPFDQGRADKGAQWNREQQRSALYEGRNINDIKTPLTAKQLQVQAANDKVRQFSDEHSRRFSEIEEQLPEGEIYREPPDQKAAFDAEYQRLQEERNALVESLYPNEVRALKDLLPDIDAQAVQPRKQLSQFSAKANEEAGFFGPDKIPDTANDNPFEGMTDKRGFSNKASDVKNRLLEHPEGPAGERGKEVLRYTQSKVANTLKGSIPDSLAEYHTFAEANPDYVAQVTPLMVKRVAAELRGGHARGLKVGGADNIPGQRAHTEAIAEHFNQLADDLEANPTPENIYRIKDEVGAFESDRNLGPRFGRSNDSPRLVSKGSSRHPTAERWEGIVKELEAENAPDIKYRDILSTGSKDELKRGQTWKSKVLDGIKYYNEINSKKTAPKAKAELVDQRVTDPSGKHLGDIVITEKRIKALQEHPVFKDMTREQVIQQLHGAQLETMLEKAGIAENARSRVKVEPIDYNTNKTTPVEVDPTSRADSGMYKIESQDGVEFPNDTLAGPSKVGLDTAGSRFGEFGAESLTDYSGSSGPPLKTKPSAFKTSTRVELNPDVDFGPGGDIKPIVQEVRRLDSDGAADSRYRKLLPEIMRNELSPGETWKGKLDRLITEIQGELGPEQGAQRLAEMDAFNESLKQSTGAEPPSEIPLLPKFSKIDMNSLSKGKLDKRPEQWISPRVQQKFPDLARRLRDLNKKK